MSVNFRCNGSVLVECFAMDMAIIHIINLPFVFNLGKSSGLNLQCVTK
ncbi:Uncharacterised protein [Cedecea lapagei]|uniref:Uncharacterized protein n=1 Tax=Cedecea lapagei TaxID=158823 RepID=A0A3S4KVR1_9ENTR|nr:Uncharacterised protein [Cedecea lapagei]